MESAAFVFVSDYNFLSVWILKNLHYLCNYNAFNDCVFVD